MTTTEVSTRILDAVCWDSIYSIELVNGEWFAVQGDAEGNKADAAETYSVPDDAPTDRAN